MNLSFNGLFSMIPEPVVYLFPWARVVYDADSKPIITSNLKVINDYIFSAQGIEKIICNCGGKLGIVTAGILVHFF